MPNHIAWSSIELLHNVVRTLRHLNADAGMPFPTAHYRAKVKLHGTNCGVQVTSEGVFAQSRTQMLTPGSGDYKGFAAWAQGLGFFENLAPGVTVFGEWCGPGVESGMAISGLPGKVFAVFAIQVGLGEAARIVYEPSEILAHLGALPTNVHVLPWEGGEIVIDYASEASLEARAAEISALVEIVEAEDPWVKRTFGLAGLGEGLVFYPVGDGVPTDAEGLARWMFKAKGLKHRTAGASQAAQVEPTVVAGVDAFVDLMVTEARLEQGVSALGGREPKLTGRFLQWVADDVRKESVAEIEAAGLTWDQVGKAVQAKARGWFLHRAA